MTDTHTKEVVNSYMNAIYELAQEQNCSLDEVKNNLNVLKEVIDTLAGSNLNTLLCIGSKNFDSIIESLKEHNKISDLIYRFSKVLNSNHHFFIISKIIEKWDVFILEKQGYKKLEITTCISLTKEELDSLKQELEAIINNKIYIKHKVRTSIIGGIVIKYDNFLFDDSILWKLNNLENTMKGTL